MRNLIFYPLNIILIIAFLLRVINLNYNTPFLDEAIYFKLGQSILAGTWENLAPFNWVGGFPFFYPVISAISGSISQIIGARLFNSLLGTYSVYLMYHFAKNLNLRDNNEDNEFIGGLSAFILAISSVPIYLSRIAIYDMLSFTLLLGSLTLLHKVLNHNNRSPWYKENLLFLSSFLLFLSFLAKYTTLIIFPIIALWAIFQSWNKNNLSLKLVLNYFIVPLIMLSLIYIIWTYSDLVSFWQNQISSVTPHYSEILSNFFNYSLPVSLFAIPGLIILAFKKNNFFLYFLFSSLTLPIIHLITNNIDTSIQHTYLVLIYLIPPLSYSLSLLPKWQPALKISVSLLVLFLVYAWSYPQIIELENSWPNSTAVMSFLKPLVSQENTILTSEGEVTNLALPEIPDKNITGFWDFDYKGETGTEAYKWAIRDGYFTYILINKNLDSDMANLINQEATAVYETVYTDESFSVLNHKRTIF